MNVEHIIMVIKLDIVINNIMAKVVYFGFEFMRIIYNKLNYNSNKVIIDFYDKDIKDVCVNKYILDKCINKLQSTHCIRRTNIFKVYIVNHNIIFKGDYLDFIKTYNAIYRNAFTVTNVYGHIILDKSINYGKQ